MTRFFKTVLSSRRGVSLIELLVYAGMTYFIVTWTVSFFKLPAMLNAADQKRQAEITAVAASDTFLSDLSEASPSSFDWTQIPVPGSAFTSGLGDTITFQKASYDLSNPSNPPTLTQVVYQLQPAAGGLANWVRTITTPWPGGTVTTTLLLSNLETSTASQFVVEQDSAATHVITLTMAYHFSTTVGPVQVVRRLAILG